MQAVSNSALGPHFMPLHLCTSRPHCLGQLPSFPVGLTHPSRSRAAASSFSKHFLSLPPPSPLPQSFLPLCSPNTLSPPFIILWLFPRGLPTRWVLESLEDGDPAQLRPCVRTRIGCARCVDSSVPAHCLGHYLA